MEQAIFKLKGLNRKTKSGVYATVEYGVEDWFHSDIDDKEVPVDRQYALFDMFKNSDDNLWSGKDHKVKVKFDRYSTSGQPINPIITELLLDI